MKVKPELNTGAGHASSYIYINTQVYYIPTLNIYVYTRIVLCPVSRTQLGRGVSLAPQSPQGAAGAKQKSVQSALLASKSVGSRSPILLLYIPYMDTFIYTHIYSCIYIAYIVYTSQRTVCLTIVDYRRRETYLSILPHQWSFFFSFIFYPI